MAYWSRNCLHPDLSGNQAFKYDSDGYILAGKYHVSHIIGRGYGIHSECSNAPYRKTPAPKT